MQRNRITFNQPFDYHRHFSKSSHSIPLVECNFKLNQISEQIFLELRLNVWMSDKRWKNSPNRILYWTEILQDFIWSKMVRNNAVDWSNWPTDALHPAANWNKKILCFMDCGCSTYTHTQWNKSQKPNKTNMNIAWVMSQNIQWNHNRR